MPLVDVLKTLGEAGHVSSEVIQNLHRASKQITSETAPCYPLEGCSQIGTWTRVGKTCFICEDDTVASAYLIADAIDHAGTYPVLKSLLEILGVLLGRVFTSVTTRDVLLARVGFSIRKGEYMNVYPSDFGNLDADIDAAMERLQVPNSILAAFGHWRLTEGSDAENALRDFYSTYPFPQWIGIISDEVLDPGFRPVIPNPTELEYGEYRNGIQYIPESWENFRVQRIPGFEADSLAFNQCGSLVMHHLPVNLRFIGDEAFAGCFNLQPKRLPGTLEHIGTDAFVDCIDYGIMPVNIRQWVLERDIGSV
jgi:hypothetical protein